MRALLLLSAFCSVGCYSHHADAIDGGPDWPPYAVALGEPLVTVEDGRPRVLHVLAPIVLENGSAQPRTFSIAEMRLEPAGLARGEGIRFGPSEFSPTRIGPLEWGDSEQVEVEVRRVLDASDEAVFTAECSAVDRRFFISLDTDVDLGEGIVTVSNDTPAPCD